MFGKKIRERRFPLLIVCLSLVVLFSCSDNSEKNKIVLEALNESITNSSRVFEKSTQTLYTSFEMKLTDPVSREKAEIWRPRVKQIRDSTKDIIRYIDRLKADVIKENSLTNHKIAGLYVKLKNYKDNILKIDPKINNAFINTMTITTQEFDSLRHDVNGFSKTFFDNFQAEGIISVLSMFQNNILITENTLMLFCHDQSTEHTTIHEWITAIVPKKVSFSCNLQFD